MVLAIDIGNTNIACGCFSGEEILLTERISTNANATPLEFAVSIKTILDLHGVSTTSIEGCIISSVVPSVNAAMQTAVEMVAHCSVLFVGPGVRTGLVIAIDNPAQLGSDRVCDAVAALSMYTPPLVIVDMGTATTLSVLDAAGRHIGGMIASGVGISLDALTMRTAQLPRIAMTPPPHAIGKNTVDCMRSGVLYGAAGQVDGLIDRIEEQLGCSPKVIATGGYAGVIVPYCRHTVVHEPQLLLRGLQIIYDKNRG